MFADERADTAKKRADEAKQRRIRAKREKEAKEARKRKELERREASAGAADSSATTSVVASKGTSGVAGASPIANTKESEANATITTSTFSHTPTQSSDEPQTVAQKAAEQRKIRAEARAKVSAATHIQSIVRSKQSAATAREEQRNIFDRRVSDLIALAGILKRTQQNDGNNGDYIPPPATASIMTTQFLFFAYPTTLKKREVKLENASMILEDRDLSRWTKLVKHVLLPGMSSENSDLDPLLPWMESLAGKLRLEKVLELCVSSISRKRKVSKGNTAANVTTCDRSNASDCYASVDSFLRTILRLGIPTEGGGSVYRGSTRDAVYQKSRAMLLQSVSSNQQSIAPSSGSKGQDNEPVSCDIMLSLRFILLYGSDGNTAPIPPDAERLRDKCISKDEKERIGLLFSLTADLLASPDSSGGDIGTYLSSRFVTEVLTVPLLVWKIPPSAYERLIQTTGSKTPPQLVVYIHHFINWNADKISDGRIDVALNVNGVSLSVCPAPAVLCLLANLTQIGKQCVLINGMDPKRFHYKGEEVSCSSYTLSCVRSNKLHLSTPSCRGILQLYCVAHQCGTVRNVQLANVGSGMGDYWIVFVTNRTVGCCN